jgi:hypothetical protein
LLWAGALASVWIVAGKRRVIDFHLPVDGEDDLGGREETVRSFQDQSYYADDPAAGTARCMRPYGNQRIGVSRAGVSFVSVLVGPSAMNMNPRAISNMKFCFGSRTPPFGVLGSLGSKKTSASLALEIVSLLPSCERFVTQGVVQNKPASLLTSDWGVVAITRRSSSGAAIAIDAKAATAIKIKRNFTS